MRERTRGSRHVAEKVERRLGGREARDTGPGLGGGGEGQSQGNEEGAVVVCGCEEEEDNATRERCFAIFSATFPKW